MIQVDRFDTTYRRIKHNNQKRKSLKKTLDSILFSCAVIATVPLGIETAKKVNEQIEIARNYETINNKAKQILTENITIEGTMMHFDSYNIAEEIKLLTKQKGSFYGKAVLINILNYIDPELYSSDECILSYLEIPAESLEEYVALEGYNSYYEMITSYKKEYYEQKMKRTRIKK